jgi:hypothetical protein
MCIYIYICIHTHILIYTRTFAISEPVCSLLPYTSTHTHTHTHTHLAFAVIKPVGSLLQFFNPDLSLGFVFAL